MNFSLKALLFLSFIAIQTFLAPSFADEIPGYIGHQSFRLQDDRELYELSRRADEQKAELARIDQNKEHFEHQIREIQKQRSEVLERMNKVQKEIDGTQALKASLQAKLNELKKAPEGKAEQISLLEAQILSTEQLSQDKSKQLGALKIEIGPINVRLDQITNDFSILQRRSQEASARLQRLMVDRENYRQKLISAIQLINREGANRGQVDGSNDGFSLARRLGIDIGGRDGDEDGYQQGTIAGQDRYYKRGADQGERDGSSRARLEGERDGQDLGFKNGNSAAGNREGETAGNKRADESNAAAIGIEQGKKAGFERAVRTGSIDGNTIGENQAVSKFENSELNNVILNGAFAGSFQRRSPNYPGDFNGPSFNPNTFNSNDLLRRAYTDGYVDRYREFARYEFLRRIDSEYNSVYERHYSVAFDQAANREYPDYYDRGRREADARAYSRDYPIVKAEAYKRAFEAANANPTRSSDEFRNSFNASELSAFNLRFEKIRKANFDRIELATFNENIKEQTEIYRQKRIAEVTAVFNNNAILSFVNSEVFDGGISGIAKNDGVFQPGEAILHNITLKNFGFVTAKNVSVQLDNGEIIKLQEIPARSLVTIKGAGKSQISLASAIGSKFKSSLRVLSALTSDDVVEAIHFDSIGSSVLKNADIKSLPVNYPLALSNLSLGAQLLKGVANKLSLSVSNNSKRAFTGKMIITVNINSQSDLLSKKFSELASLQTTAVLNDAEVLVENDADIYRDLAFSATISENGVILGVLQNDFITMAKSQYSERAKLPVIVVDSNKHLKQLLDALSTLKGTENASVLDLSLTSLNTGILANGLAGKVLLIIDDESAVSTKSLNTFIAKSKNSSFVFIDEASTGLKAALNLSAAKDAQKVLLDKRGIYFTNPYRAEGVVKSSAMLQSSLKNFENDISLATDLSQSASEMLARFKSDINRNSFFTPNISVKLFSLRSMAEILCINKAYNESGGVFSRNKKWINMIGEDTSLLINILKTASKGNVDEGKLSYVLPAIALKDTVSNAMANAEGISIAMMGNITKATNKVLDNMEDSFKNSLKDFSKDLYNKAYEKASIHRPFYIDPPRNGPFPH